MYKFKDIIEEVEERNTDLRYGLDDIIGVTIEKGLIPTVANLAQTSLEKFYIVKPETFVYNPRTHGVRLGMGFNNTTNIYITSWNNVAFRIKKEAQNIVIPYYLWLFFCRPIWDRLTNFLAWGSSTIVFAWKDFLNIDIVLPSIEYQREIVSEYETLSNRIRLNNQMIQNLEATAQALYRKTFVDNIDKENLPEGWRMGTFTDVVRISGGGTPDTSDICFWNGDIPFFTPADSTNDYYCIKTEKSLTIEGLNNCSSKLYEKNSTFVTARGTVGEVSLAGKKMAMNQSCYALLSKESYVPFYIHQLSIETISSLKEEAVGAVFRALVTKDFELKEVIIPPVTLMEEYNSVVSNIYNNILIRQNENSKLTELQSLLLAKMGQ